MEDLRAIIFDTETTSVDKTKRAVEVAMMEIDLDTLEEVGRAESLINPGIPIPPEVTAIHGITDAMVAGAPSIEDWVIDTFGGRLEGEVALIGHRVAFDAPLFEPIGHAAHLLDTLVLSQVYITGSKNRKLDTLKEYLGLPGGGESHRAMADVLTCHQLLRHIMPLTGRSLTNLAAVPYTILHHAPWGRWEGTLLYDVPKSYRDWMLSTDNLDINLRKSLEMVALADPPKRELVMGRRPRILIPKRK